MKHAHDVSRSSIARGACRAALAAFASLALAACGSVDLVASTNIPTPLVTKVPVTVALHVPKEFSEYVHKEERWSTDWNVNLGKAQTEGITRLMKAMFDNVVVVDSLNAGSQLGGDVRAILEPSVEEYAFVTPRDAGSQFYAVSIKYRVNIYMPDGRLAESWGFTGYGTSPAQGLSSSEPLAHATALAMRDAGAKLAVEFREQAVVRGLLPSTESVAAPAAAPEAAPPVSEPTEQSQPIATPPVTEPAEQSQPTATPPEAPAAPNDKPEDDKPEDDKPETGKPESESEPKPTTSPGSSTPESLAILPTKVGTAFGRINAE